MARAVVAWNPERDACVISWGIRPTDYPLDAINFALAKFYNAGLRPFVYEAYDGDHPTGLLLADSMELADEEILSLFQQIKTANELAPQTGDYQPETFVV